MINWIEKWPIDRRQRVTVDGEVLNWKSVLSGVPQGSVLEPILFLISMYDLDDASTQDMGMTMHNIVQQLSVSPK